MEYTEASKTLDNWFDILNKLKFENTLSNFAKPLDICVHIWYNIYRNKQGRCWGIQGKEVVINLRETF